MVVKSKILKIVIEVDSDDMVDNVDKEFNKKKRETWGNGLDFFLSSLGLAGNNDKVESLSSVYFKLVINLKRDDFFKNFTVTFTKILREPFFERLIYFSS